MRSDPDYERSRTNRCVRRTNAHKRSFRWREGCLRYPPLEVVDLARVD
jgi:hypothetical protein